MPKTVTEHLLMEFKCLSQEEFNNLDFNKRKLYQDLVKYQHSYLKKTVLNSKEYYEKNKDEINEKKRNIYKQKKSEISKKYRSLNREKLNEKARDNYKLNSESILEKAKIKRQKVEIPKQTYL